MREERTVEDSDYPCPSCGFLVFDEPPGSYVICPVCGWEDDHVQLRYPSMRGGANKISLYESQRNFMKKVSAGEREYLGYMRCFAWRCLNESDLETDDDAPKSSLEYFDIAAEASAPYYWEKKR